jgi:hypothetical protein
VGLDPLTGARREFRIPMDGPPLDHAALERVGIVAPGILARADDDGTLRLLDLGRGRHRTLVDASDGLRVRRLRDLAPSRFLLVEAWTPERTQRQAVLDGDTGRLQWLPAGYSADVLPGRADGVSPDGRFLVGHLPRPFAVALGGTGAPRDLADATWARPTWIGAHELLLGRGRRLVAVDVASGVTRVVVDLDHL